MPLHEREDPCMNLIIARTVLRPQLVGADIIERIA